MAILGYITGLCLKKKKEKYLFLLFVVFFNSFFASFLNARKYMILREKRNQ